MGWPIPRDYTIESVNVKDFFKVRETRGNPHRRVRLGGNFTRDSKHWIQRQSRYVF